MVASGSLKFYRRLVVEDALIPQVHAFGAWIS
jgi:hypothetical protein